MSLGDFFKPCTIIFPLFPYRRLPGSPHHVNKSPKKPFTPQIYPTTKQTTTKSMFATSLLSIVAKEVSHSLDFGFLTVSVFPACGGENNFKSSCHISLCVLATGPPWMPGVPAGLRFPPGHRIGTPSLKRPGCLTRLH